MESKGFDSPLPALASLRSFIDSESSEAAPAAPPSSGRVIKTQESVTPGENWPEDLREIVVDGQLSGTDRNEFMAVRRLPEGMLKRMSQSQSHEELPQESPVLTMRLTLKSQDLPEILLDEGEETPSDPQPFSTPRSEQPIEEPRQSQLGNNTAPVRIPKNHDTASLLVTSQPHLLGTAPVTSLVDTVQSLSQAISIQSAQFPGNNTSPLDPTPVLVSNTVSLPAPLEDMQGSGTADISALISPQVRAVLVDSSKFTFGPPALSHSSSDSELPIDETVADHPQFRRKVSDHPEVPRLNLGLIRPQEQPNRLIQLTYTQCVQLLITDIEKYMSPRVEPKPKCCAQWLFSCCKRSNDRQNEVDLQSRTLLALDKRPLGEEDLDKRVIYSVWRLLRPGRNLIVPSEEWLSVGFRTKDPRKEASSLAFLQLLYLLSEKTAYSAKLLDAAKQRGTAFPFAQECISAVSLAVKVFKSGDLNSILQEKRDVFGTFNVYFLGCLDMWFREHQRSPGYVDRSLLETAVRRNPKLLLRQTQNNVQ